ncbi:hypothetical protein KSF_040420 [Reticulibacter mediterranei]|uniref:Uncharacterized protein n=1 Tax=Reticulibacter mediterranei TaxID=2778369 RepID=A0A8J3ILX6_9CHLR|nr:hypothetical protein [Reticulibacter mediterranei]GHO93994.1 hypothetical protein KSF_040420 [Reticulibacter mediterranei]
MNLNTFKQIRHQIYQYYERSADALFESCDVIPPCVNDLAMTELVQKAASAAVGEDHVDNDEEVMTAG